MTRESAIQLLRKDPAGADESLKSLVKVVRILDCFTAANRALTLSEICSATGYPRSTTHRLISSMRDVGLLDQDRQRDRYRLGLKLFKLGNIVLANMDLHREARVHVDALSRMSGQAVHLAVFDGREAIVVNRADQGPEAGTPLTLIEAAPAHCTSVGKAILAFQPEEVIDRLIEAGLTKYTDATIVNPRKLKADLAATRKRGYAVDDGEHQPGLRCIGAPIRDNQGRVVAAISVSGPSWKIPVSEIEGLSKLVIHHARQISANL